MRQYLYVHVHVCVEPESAYQCCTGALGVPLHSFFDRNLGNVVEM
jgi:hypothetical protein